MKLVSSNCGWAFGWAVKAKETFHLSAWEAKWGDSAEWHGGVISAA